MGNRVLYKNSKVVVFLGVGGFRVVLYEPGNHHKGFLKAFFWRSLAAQDSKKG